MLTDEGLREAIRAAGSGIAVDVRPLSGGLGAATLWRVVLSDGRACVARVFTEGAARPAERERLAMVAAREGGVRVPSVQAEFEVAGFPVMLIDLVPGRTALDAIRRRPADAARLGRSMGEQLARLHGVVAPSALTDEGWLTLGGDALAPLAALLRRLPHPDRLLHLDFHPLNVLADDEVTGVIDWANARSGPPFLDLARSQAIIHAARVAGVLPAAPPGPDPVDELMRGLRDGHAATFGSDPRPAVSRAWALAMTVADVGGHVGRAGSPFTAEVVARLARDRDAAIARAIATGI